MKIIELARPGDKIDITYLHQNNGKTYKSSVFDFLNETTVEIGMPTEAGKMVLFQVGFECSMFFYTQKGMFTCSGKVLSRYKKDGFFMMAVRLTSDAKKYQRREYFRVDVIYPFNYYGITKEVAQGETTESLLEEIAKPEYIEAKRQAYTIDLSGGGIRFASEEELERDSYLIIVLRLVNEKVNRTMYLASQVIDCFRSDRNSAKYVVRAKFLFKTDKDRETMVRYVFEEDRMRRKRENGE